MHSDTRRGSQRLFSITLLLFSDNTHFSCLWTLGPCLSPMRRVGIYYWYPQKIVHFYFYTHMLPFARTFFCLKISAQIYLPWLSGQEDKYLSLPLYVTIFFLWVHIHFLYCTLFFCIDQKFITLVEAFKNESFVMPCTTIY